jgi:DNA-binding CsgD family transcriptional regulator
MNTKDWVEVRNGYVAVRHITALTPIQVAGGWQVRVTTVDGATHHLPDQQDTREAARAAALHAARVFTGEAEKPRSEFDYLAQDIIPEGRPGAGMRPSEYAMSMAAAARTRAEVLRLHDDGKTPKQIVRITGVNIETVASILATPRPDEVKS